MGGGQPEIYLPKTMKHFPFPLLTLTAALLAATLPLAPPARAASPRPARLAPAGPANPSDANIAAALDAAARINRVPTVLVRGLAWHQSGWRQWDSAGKPVETKGRVGIMGVAVAGRDDAARLRDDWRYNVAEGVRALVLAWNRAPIIGDTGRLDDGRNILESWYFAVGRYGAGRDGQAAQVWANGVWDTLAGGGGGHWEAVNISRPSAAQLAWGRNVQGTPAPWHFGEVCPRPPAVSVVEISVPYLSQIYDSPDKFDGGGACGPTSMVMVMARYNKVSPQPLTLTENFPHQTLYGGYIPQVEDRVCLPNMGAVHAKMLDYLRPLFPDVAIFYNDKATYARVLEELKAGRPCLLGTQVTPAGHIMVARGFLKDGRLIVNDPAGDREQVARRGGPDGSWSPTGGRYWNGGGGRALYDWDALQVRWVMTLGDGAGKAGDTPEDAGLR